MAKIDLNTVSSGYLSQAALNANFTAIENEFQNKVLYRDNPSGEPNSMQTHLDMNGYHVLNAGNPSLMDADNIAYTPDGTGAETRTIAEKLNEVVSVKDFGAVGDGVTDDTAAIQAALTSGASAVDFSNGEYAISTQINVLYPVVIFSRGGGVIKPIGNAAVEYVMFNVQASNVTFDGITIDGNTDKPPISAPSGGYLGISLNANNGTLTDFTLKNCVLKNFSAYGISAFTGGTLKRVRFENSRFIRFTNTSPVPPAAIQLVQPTSSEISVNGCDFDDMTGTGFAVRSVNGTAPCANVSITGCTFNNKAFLYSSLGVEVLQAVGLAVSGNTFANARMGLSFNGSNIAVSGNTFINHEDYSIEAGLSDGLAIAGNSFTDFQYGVILYSGADDISITGNTFRNALPGATTAANFGWAIQTSANSLSENYNRLIFSNNTVLNCSGFQLTRAQDTVISGNTFETTTADNKCMVSAFSSLNDGLIIESNVFRTSIDQAGADAGLIQYAGSRVSIRGNTLISTTGSANAGSAICNAPGTTLTDVVIESNIARNFALGVNAASGSPTISNVTVSANIYSACTSNELLSSGVRSTEKLAASMQDFGDSDVTLTAKDAGVIRLTATLTTNRTITLDTTSAYRGQRFRILRLGGGAFTLSVGGLKTLLQNEWVDVVYTTSLWAVCGSGSLVPRILSGSGTPEGAVTAPVGTLFTRTDGGAATTLYVKETGTGNTGWVAK